MLLMLKKSRAAPMKRNVRDDAGHVIRSYEFAPGGVQEVHDDDILAVADDILFGVLLPVEVVNFNPVVIDYDFDELKDRVAKLRAAAKAKALSGGKPKPKKTEAPANETAPADVDTTLKGMGVTRSKSDGKKSE